MPTSHTKNTYIKTPTQPLFDELHQINWEAPWLTHIPNVVRNLNQYQTGANNPSLADALNQSLTEFCNKKDDLLTGMGKSLEFITQSVFDNLPTPTAYETHIANTGQVPTRNNLHDLFNAWIWFTFPKTKALLNRYQAQQIAADGVTSSRGRVRDAITIFDECGAVFVTSDTAVADALKNFDWQNALVKPRENWVNPVEDGLKQNGNTLNAINSTTAVYIFGHATLEQLVEPRKPICSHCKIILVDASFFDLPAKQRITFIDEQLTKEIETWLQQPDVKPQQLSPLPILGVPHFWAANADASFYEDTFVFRSGRRKKQS